jgi:hydroxyacid-oxoacid transhydrogenase
VALEYAFEMAASAIRFGPGVTREIGMDLAEMKLKRVMVLTDPNLVKLQPVATVLESLRSNRVQFALFDRVRVEPTDASFREAIAFATQGDFDAFVAVGGGSTIDTAKAADLYATHPADFLDYVNAPIGKGKPVPGPLKPLIAVPTTAGTAARRPVWRSSTTPPAAKTGIAHRRLKPTLGSSIRRTPGACPEVAASVDSTSSATPSSRTPRSPSTSGHVREASASTGV